MSPRAETAGRPARILIVDDELSNRKVLEVMLAKEGYSLLTASNGEEALAEVARQPPDLILLDVMMPGMNGYQVVGRLKSGLATKNIPIIMVSALTDRNDKMRGLNEGAEDYLAKPVDRAEVCVRVRNLLRLKAHGDSLGKDIPGKEPSVPKRSERHAHDTDSLQICPTCGRCYDQTRPKCVEDGATLDSPRTLPYVLLGRYRFLQVLGQGGMGVVISAHDTRLDRDVAVKLVRPEQFSNAAVKQRFEREARAVARIQHPGVVELHDSGELEDGSAFLVMERLSGCDLKLVLQSYGRGKPAQVARLVRQGSAALGAAHRAGLVHRDVKPANVFLVDDPNGFRVKLLDFGIAKSMAFDSGLTQRGAVLGTPGYMAPEAVRGEEVDNRSDVYSFAAVAYEALTGRRVVPANDVARIFIDVLHAIPPQVSSLLSGLPPAVDAAFAAALAKNPADRPTDIERWASSFVDLLETVSDDDADAGWPISKDVFSRLRNSFLDHQPTVYLPRATRPA